MPYDSPFRYEGQTLCCESVALADIAARIGTPCYVYSATDIIGRYRAYDRALDGLPHEICYAVKANSNLSVLRLLAAAGSGFDIVSGGELFRVLRAGGDPNKIVFSGVGKTAEEIEYAIRERIHSFNCESDEEIDLIDALSGRAGVRSRVSLRVNPDVDAVTHPYISTGLREHKFGIDIAEIEHVYARAAHMPNLAVEGISCHIGSQLLQAAPMMEAIDRMLELIERLRNSGVPPAHLDLGGGLGVRYRPDETAPCIEDYARAIGERVRGRDLHILVEPGRSVVGEAGVLLMRVLYRKRTARKEFVVVDAAMNDLLRPALYEAHHEILPVRRRDEQMVADVVGPVCESADFLARDRTMASVFPGDLLAVSTAGAYGFVQSSNYNSRPRAAEVLVESDQWRVIRKRETYEDLVRGE
ncbi:MAG TPA: diaminopimelate decarboxylase [Bryobacteraceae bacterium]|nr:diaminopimelate decarboxylase [Bryobacteraceae bacterium]